MADDYIAVPPVNAVTVNDLNRVIQDFNLRMQALYRRLEEKQNG